MIYFIELLKGRKQGREGEGEKVKEEKERREGRKEGKGGREEGNRKKMYF